jgi:hypothetical protein
MDKKSISRSGIQIRDEHPISYFRKQRKQFFGSNIPKFFDADWKSFLDPGWKYSDPG